MPVWVIAAGGLAVASLVAAVLVVRWWPWRRPRLVRVHIAADPGKPDTLEGFLAGVWGGHYILKRARVIEAPGRSHTAGDLEVPVGRVLFLQRISGGER